MSDREMLEIAAKAAGLEFDDGRQLNPKKYLVRPVGSASHDDWYMWNPLTDYGDALQLAVKLRINLLFSGGFHYVGTNPHIFDICRLGGIDDICWEIVNVAAEIGRGMP